MLPSKAFPSSSVIIALNCEVFFVAGDVFLVFGVVGATGPSSSPLLPRGGVSTSASSSDCHTLLLLLGRTLLLLLGRTLLLLQLLGRTLLLLLLLLLGRTLLLLGATWLLLLGRTSLLVKGTSLLLLGE